MRSELEVRRELKEIETLLAAMHANSFSGEVAYGAYRALTWMLGQRMPASEALEVMEAWAAEREKEAKA